MTIPVGFCNQKGGVGKTTTAINLAASIAVAEKKTLLIDFDPQANATSGLGYEKGSVDPASTSYSLLWNPAGIVPCKTEIPYLDLIPSTTELVGAEIELTRMEGRETILKKSLATLQDQYDFIMIDSPPSLGLLTLNVLAAADFLIVPVQSEYYALEGLADLTKTVELVKSSLNPGLKIGGILLTMHDARNNLANEVEREIRNHFGEAVFLTLIPRNVRLSEAPSHGKPIILYDVKSKGAVSYLELAKEFLERVEEKLWTTQREVLAVGSPH